MHSIRIYFHYYALVLFFSVSLYLGTVWVPVIPLWLHLLFNSTSLKEIFSLSLHLFSLAFFDTTPLLTAYNIFISILVSVNLTLFIFYFKKNRQDSSHVSTVSGLVGLITILFGFGCASCGTLFFTVFLSSLGGSGLIMGPLANGAAFQTIGITLLFFSIISIVWRIHNPPVCLI